MTNAQRRDAFCGKLSMMDVFFQNDIRFTALKPHTVAPASDAFASNLDHFDRVCRVVRGLKRTTIGAIGARTSPFKTVRIDEVTLQRAGVTVETFDLADVFAQIRTVDASGPAYDAKAMTLRAYNTYRDVPDAAFDNIVRLAVVLDAMVEENGLDAIAVRCWLEMQQQLGISPCVAMSEMNNRGVFASCEVDVGSALAMRALGLASGDAAACLDWNNNYGEEEEKCILFHCSAVPQSMMVAKGCVTEHDILANAVGRGCSYGCSTGRLKPSPFTYAGMMTHEGRVRSFLGEARITDDPVPAEFFGCAGVAEVPGLQDLLLRLGRTGHRHHVSITQGHCAAAVYEALGYYLGYDVEMMPLA
jgi:L-fucose isomerase-like protein